MRKKKCGDREGELGTRGSAGAEWAVKKIKKKTEQDTKKRGSGRGK
jgi:hypothetical protein